MPKITNATLKSAFDRRTQFQGGNAGKAYREVVRDSSFPGLALVVNGKGASWVYSYRPAGMEKVETSPGVFETKRPSTRHLKLGDVFTLSPDAAREAAAAVKMEIVAKKDPALERREQQKKREQAVKKASCSSLVDTYRAHLGSTVSRKTRRHLGERHIAAEIANLTAAFDALGIGSIAPDAITLDHLHDIPLKASGTATARHWHGALRRFLQWGVQNKRVASNTAVLVPLPPAPVSRDRWLTSAEIKEVWKGSFALTDVFGSFVRFLMCIPARRDEAAKMRWSALDLSACTWSQEGTSTKNGEPHRFALHALAMEIILQRLDAERMVGESREQAFKRLKAADALVFRSPRDSVISGFSKVLAQLHKASGTKDWSYHDLRRSFASHLGESGADRDVVDAILNHKASSTSSGVMGVYNRSTRHAAQAATLAVWGKMLGGFVGHVPAATEGNVVAFSIAGA